MIVPQFIQPTLSLFDDSQAAFVAIEKLRLKVQNNLEIYDFQQEDEIDVSDLLRNLAQDTSFEEKNLVWEKICNGHSIKLGKHMSKGEANDLRRQKHKEREQDQEIYSIHTENRGDRRHRVDPFIMFKYLNNCSRCVCPDTKVLKKNNVKVIDILNQLETCSSVGDLSHHYNKIYEYIFGG